MPFLASLRTNQLAVIKSILSVPVSPTGVLFIYGNTGTGKTSLIDYLMKNKNQHGLSSTRFVFLNILRLTRFQSLYSSLFASISGSKKRTKTTLSSLVSLFLSSLPGSSKKRGETEQLVVVLDEVDKITGGAKLLQLKSLLSLCLNQKAKTFFRIFVISNDPNYLPHHIPELFRANRKRFELLAFKPFGEKDVQRILMKSIDKEGDARVERLAELVSKRNVTAFADIRSALSEFKQCLEKSNGQSGNLMVVGHHQRGDQKAESLVSALPKELREFQRFLEDVVFREKEMVGEREILKVCGNRGMGCVKGRLDVLCDSGVLEEVKEKKVVWYRIKII